MKNCHSFTRILDIVKERISKLNNEYEMKYLKMQSEGTQIAAKREKDTQSKG